MNRYEYYNSLGTLVGYKTYDSLMQTWNYYDVSQQTQAKSNYEYVQPINLKLVNQALATNQGKYDNNISKVQNAIDEVRNSIQNSGYSESVIQLCLSDFNTKCVGVLNKNNYDYSSNSKTTEIINWLYSSINSFAAFYLQHEKAAEDKKKLNESIQKKATDDKIEAERSKALAEFAKFYGGYTTKLVTEEIYNANNPKLYDVIFEDKSTTKFYFQNSHLFFLRSKNKKWLTAAWVWFITEANYYILYDDYNQMIAINKDFKTITFYSDKVGNVYKKRYVYHELKKDNTVKPN